MVYNVCYLPSIVVYTTSSMTMTIDWVGERDTRPSLDQMARGLTPSIGETKTLERKTLSLFKVKDYKVDAAKPSTRACSVGWACSLLDRGEVLLAGLM